MAAATVMPTKSKLSMRVRINVPARSVCGYEAFFCVRYKSILRATQGKRILPCCRGSRSPPLRARTIAGASEEAESLGCPDSALYRGIGLTLAYSEEGNV